MLMPSGKYEGYKIEEVPTPYLMRFIESGRAQDDHELTAAILGWLRLWIFGRDEDLAATLAFDAADPRRLREALKHAYRRVASYHHPICGGSQDAIDGVNDLYDTFIHILAGDAP
jgi:hypothetical protein